MNVGLVSPVNDRQLAINGAVASEIQTALKNQCDRFNQDLLGIVNAHQAKLNEISKDQSLSDLGKASKRTDLLDTYIGMVAKIGEEARLWSARAENFRAQIRRDEATLMPPAGDPVAESRAREIRSLLRGVDPAERIKRYSDAVTAGDFETQAAIERAPKPFPLLEADVLARLVEERRAKSHPTQIADAQSLDEAATWLTAVCEVCRQRMSR